MIRKLRLCWALLRGHRVAYRLIIQDGALYFPADRKAYIMECVIRGESEVEVPSAWRPYIV